MSLVTYEETIQILDGTLPRYNIVASGLRKIVFVYKNSSFPTNIRILNGIKNLYRITR